MDRFLIFIGPAITETQHRLVTVSGDQQARARRDVGLHELSHLANQLAMVDGSWSVWCMPAEDRAQGSHDLGVAMHLHCLQIGQHRSQFTLMDPGDLAIAFALREGLSQRGNLLAENSELFRELGKSLLLLLDGVIATSNEGVTLEEPSISLGNLAISLSNHDVSSRNELRS